MLRLNRFTYLRPDSLQEAGRLLERQGSDAMLLAGGTDLLVNIKQRVCTPSLVIGIRHLPELHGIRDDGDGLTIGAGTSLKSLETDPRVQRHYPALSVASHLISTPQVRALGTLGGNVCLDVRCNYYNQSAEWRKAIGYCTKKGSDVCRVAPGGDRCWAVASADTVPVLIALRAVATVVGNSGTRRVPVEALFQDDGLSPLTLRFGEIVTAIWLPQIDEWQCVYLKFRIRHSFDFPLVGVATAVRRDARGRVQDTRIVMTAVASYPQRATLAEQVLEGRLLDEGAIAEAGQMVFRAAKPMDNTAGTIFHRKRMARVLFERGLAEIAGIDVSVPSTA